MTEQLREQKRVTSEKYVRICSQTALRIQDTVEATIALEVACYSLWVDERLRNRMTLSNRGGHVDRDDVVKVLIRSHHCVPVAGILGDMTCLMQHL